MSFICSSIPNYPFSMTHIMIYDMMTRDIIYLEDYYAFGEITLLILIRSLLVFFLSFVAVSSIQAQDLDCVCKEIKRNGAEIILECVCRPKDNPNPRNQADSNINKGVVAALSLIHI